MKTVFAVDSSEISLKTVKDALELHYNVVTVPSAEKMFELLEKVVPDLILLEIEMPGEINGLEALQRLKSAKPYSGIPVIFLTGRTDAAIEARGFNLGAVDFITKPFSVPVLLNRIKVHLNINVLICERTAQLLQMHNALISIISDMVEKRNKATGGHIMRTTAYMKILLPAMADYGVYADEISGWDFDTVISSACLHDVGKIAIPDYILNKPGLLDEDEFELMKSHAEEGEEIIDQIIARTGEVEFLQCAKMFAGYHHEHWDGTGYPRRLKELEIPLQGRIMALADVYDAFLSDRPYKKAFTFDEAEELIASKSGQYFDPKIVEVFDKTKGLFREAALSIRSIKFSLFHS